MRNIKYHHGEQIREEIILLCMQWYVLYNLGYSKLQMVMKQRGFKIDGRTFNNLVKEYSILAKKRLEETKRKRQTGWRVVQIPFLLDGRKKYLYRAVDAQGNTLDFLIYGMKNKEGAKKFFQQTLSKTKGIKEEIFQEEKIKINTTNYDWFWRILIIILLIILGKVFYDLFEQRQRNSPQSPSQNLSLIILTNRNNFS